MDRRFLAAIGLMMLVVVVPSLLFKRPAPAVSPADAPATIGAPDTALATVRNGSVPTPARTSLPPAVRAAASASEDTVTVRSGLYEYTLSTRGARVIGARLLRYRSIAAADADAAAELVRAGDGLFALTLVTGRDTLQLRDWSFTPSATDVRVSGETPVTFTATGSATSGAATTVELTYSFSPDDYRIGVRGRVTGLGPTGGLLLVGLGQGLRNTEADSAGNARDFALVVKPTTQNPEAIPFRSVDVDAPRVEAGPFTWAAVKSKYFVVGAFAADSAARWSAAEVRRTDPAKLPQVAGLRLSLPVGANGAFGWRVYAGPMEYPRLGAMGDEFSDVNPYGWPGFRTVMRPFAVAFRWFFVWMHESAGLAYGVVLILTGILVRVVLWPLNQKAMRSAMEMQAIQPQVQELQTRYKSDPQKMQQAMFALYKEHGVNPMGGCWPMLLPMPVLLALFFVLQSTIEIRGVSFLWFTDLSRADPLYIIPVISGLSMFALSKLGQRGLPPNPQSTMMVYMMPVMMTIFGFNFASGLNLYWTASNLASLPQQWLLGQERLRRQKAPIVKTKK